MAKKVKKDEWTTVIRPKTGIFDLKLGEIWHYRDLIYMFLKRNFNSAYKQTILGPLWFLITPLMSSSIFTVIFGQIAKISTDGVPQFLFYLAGNTSWGYFASCLTSTSGTFTGNAGLFGKVYFPRLVAPITTVIYALLSFFIQVMLMLVIMGIYALRGVYVQPNLHLLLLPALIAEMALMGMGFGIIISSVTTKYRDLRILVGFGVSLWMYATPVVYPVSQIPENLRNTIMLNPMTPIVNNFRYAFLSSGSFDWYYWGISWIITAVVLFIGIIIFNRVEKTFMDTV